MINLIDADKDVKKYKKQINFLFKSTLEYLSQPKNIEVTVKFVNKSEIRQINKEYRGIDKVTDVLSFPFLNVKPGVILNKTDFPLDSNGKNIYLGDIAICMDKVKEQAEEYNHSFERELFYLLTHGFLHLFGYDHIEEFDKKIMREKEEEIIKRMISNE